MCSPKKDASKLVCSGLPKPRLELEPLALASVTPSPSPSPPETKDLAWLGLSNHGFGLWLLGLKPSQEHDIQETIIYEAEDNEARSMIESDIYYTAGVVSFAPC